MTYQGPIHFKPNAIKQNIQYDIYGRFSWYFILALDNNKGYNAKKKKRLEDVKLFFRQIVLSSKLYAIRNENFP